MALNTSIEPTPNPGFRYFLHAWRREEQTGLDRLAELMATDGSRVRSVRSRGAFVTYEELEQQELAGQIVEAIDREWVPGSRLMGYESLSDRKMVAILHRGEPSAGNWAVIPCTDQHFPREALTSSNFVVDDARRQHLVAGADVVWRSGRPLVQTAVEGRVWGEETNRASRGLLEAVEAIELRATVDRGDGSDEIGLVESSRRRVEPTGACRGRLEAKFPLDSVIFQNFGREATFQPWLLLEFEPDFLCVPQSWRRFWMTVEFGA